jgi:hypothetical protein
MTINPDLSTIYIYYRHVSSARQLDKSRPQWFSYEDCFSNLIGSILQSDSGVLVDVTVLFDGDEAVFNSDFISKHVAALRDSGPRLSVRHALISGGSALGAWHEVAKFANSRNDYSENSLLYFLENDYIHSPQWVKEVSNLFESGIPFDYVSLYDHSDKYPYHSHFNSTYKNLHSKIFVTKSCHWRTTPSTCGTFMVRPETFKKDYKVWKARLTDRRVFPLLRLLKRRVLVTPMPGLSTHCMSDYMSPCVQWESHADLVVRTLK